MYFTLKDEKTLHYELTDANGANGVILLVNGLTQSTIAWNGVRNLLREQFQILTVDLIFQGKSDKNCSFRSLAQHGEDLIELLEHLEINRPHVIGISLGGLVVQRMIVNFPEKLGKAILVSSFCHKTPRFQHIERAFQKALKTGGLPLLIDFMYPLALSEAYYQSPPMPIENMIKLTIENNEVSAIQHLMDAVSSFDNYTAQLQDVRNDVLVLQGELDCFVTPEMGCALADSLKNSQYQLIHDSGHSINVEVPLSLVNSVLQFIN